MGRVVGAAPQWIAGVGQPPGVGRKAEALCRCSRVCLEFEAPGCAWVDVVLLEGSAVPDAWDKDEGLALHVPAETLSGRRFFLPE